MARAHTTVHHLQEGPQQSTDMVQLSSCLDVLTVHESFLIQQRCYLVI